VLLFARNRGQFKVRGSAACRKSCHPTLRLNAMIDKFILKNYAGMQQTVFYSGQKN
jgi:hypothetical protein